MRQPAAKRLAIVRDYRQLMAVLRARLDELEITMETLDAAAGIPLRYSSKVLIDNPIKRLGLGSLGAILGVLRLALIVVEDSSARHIVMDKRKTPAKRRA